MRLRQQIAFQAWLLVDLPSIHRRRQTGAGSQPVFSNAQMMRSLGCMDWSFVTLPGAEAGLACVIGFGRVLARRANSNGLLMSGLAP